MTLVKKLTKIGNSMGIILPSEILATTGINSKSKIEMEIRGNEIILRPIDLKNHKVMKTFLSVVKDYDKTLRKLAQ